VTLCVLHTAAAAAGAGVYCCCEEKHAVVMYMVTADGQPLYTKACMAHTQVLRQCVSVAKPNRQALG
jgi:hypothetical protein